MSRRTGTDDVSRPRASFSARSSELQAADREDREPGPGDGRLPLEIRDLGIPAGARRPVQLSSTARKISTRISTGTKRTSSAPARSSSSAMRPGSRSRASAIPIIITRVCLISTVSSASSRRSRRPASRRCAATAPRSISAACRPRRATSWRRSWATRSRSQESDWNCGSDLFFNHKQKPFDDPRVRRALTLAIDRWGGAPALAKIAIVKTPGGIVFPGSPLAAKKEDLEKMAGFWPDIEKSRAEAKRLLKEAGAENLQIELLNRDVDQPYKYVGIWLVDQWAKIGVKATQKVVPTGPWFGAMRSGQFQVVHYPICRSTVNPLLDVRSLSAGLGRKLRLLQGSGRSRALRQAAARDRPCEAAGADDRVREAGAGRRRRTPPR